MRPEQASIIGCLFRRIGSGPESKKTKTHAMKKIAILTVAMLIVLVSVGQKPIIVKGKIDNCKNPDNSYIRKDWFNPKTFRIESKNFDFSIAEDGTFRAEITATDNYYNKYWIHLGSEYTQLNLTSGDSIYMTLDGSVFDETIQYSGRGAGRCNYQRDLFLDFWDKNVGSAVDNKSDPIVFLGELNSLSERRMAVLNKYMQAGEIDSNYYSIESTLIANDAANHVLKHDNRFRNHKSAPSNVISEFEKILKSAVFTEDRSMQHDLMRELVYSMPIYIAESQIQKNESKLTVAIDWAKAHYTSTMFQYFSLELMRNHLNSTKSLTEKHALIAFFDKQFDEPALKRELQLQKSRTSVNSFVNSDIFQISVIIVSWFLVAIGLVFLIVWIIQYSNRNGVKFNLSLWLKVGFYLIAFIVAMLFINSANETSAVVLVLLILVTFLVHTYIIIPRFAFKNQTIKYILLVFAELVAFEFLFFIVAPESFPTILLALLSEIFFGFILLSWISYFVHQMASGKSTLKNLRQNGYLSLELAIHLIVIFLVNLVFIANQSRDTIIEQALIFYPVVTLFYFHTFFLYPHSLRKDKLPCFFGINVAILLGVAMATATYDLFQSHNALKSIGIETKLSDLISLKNIRFDLLIVFALILIPSFAYYFVRKQLTKNESAGYNLYRKKEAELAQLKAQVNPHFLFNTLNTLYAFALKEGSEKTAECIAKLANLMRFMLDDMEKETILLEREVSYIQDYVKLQSIRSAVEHDISINVDIDEGQSYAIAPMLFIPFVENAFKHGMNPNNLSHLKIDIKGKGNQVQFVVENSIDNSFEAYYKEKGFGIGIENVKSRLKFIYPNRHNISIAKTNEKYIVILSIDL